MKEVTVTFNAQEISIVHEMLDKISLSRSHWRSGVTLSEKMQRAYSECYPEKDESR